MTNIHSPERSEGESLQAYCERRAQAKREVAHITGAGLNGGTNSREQFRNSMRANGTMGRRVRASDALMAAWASKRIPNWKGSRDEYGAYTKTGAVYTMEGCTPTKSEHVMSAGVGDGEGFYTARRKWLAGISSQRGY